MGIRKRFMSRPLLGVVVSMAVVFGCGVSQSSAADSGGTTDNVCNGPTVVNEVLTIHRDATTHTYSGTAVFSSPTGLTETYPFSHVASAHESSGTIILVNDDPILKADTLVHVTGAVYFSEGGYVARITGRWFNICKLFGDPGSTRL